MYEGTICSVRVDRGFGFISSPNQPDVFFHVRDMAAGLTFDETLKELRVRFDIVSGTKGPRAANVRPAD